jgi:N-acetylglucosaminyldiphosphoundecaprenol N-acetyl-beta-D-mannosaminyltransferase
MTRQVWPAIEQDVFGSGWVAGHPAIGDPTGRANENAELSHGGTGPPDLVAGEPEPWSAATESDPHPYLLGIPVSTVTEQRLLDAVGDAVAARTPTVFVGLYASLFRTISRDHDYRDLVARSSTYPDGKGVVSELRHRGVRDAERTATTDVVHPIARLAARRHWRIGLYGAATGVAERAAARLTASAPGVDVVAIWDGYSGGPSVPELQHAQLDVLLVALGAARQEAWAYDVGVAAGVPAILTCGGLLDFLAGDKRRAPRWMQRAGLEWAFRVILEPRRLCGRYLLGNSYFLVHARADRSVPVPSSDSPTLFAPPEDSVDGSLNRSLAHRLANISAGTSTRISTRATPTTRGPGRYVRRLPRVRIRA